MNKSFTLVPPAVVGLVLSSHSEELKCVKCNSHDRGLLLCWAAASMKNRLAASTSRTTLRRNSVIRIVGRDGQLALVALPQTTVPFAEKYRGFRVLLVNRTNAEVAFPATDSSLDIIQEAQDASPATGTPIEDLPSRSEVIPFWYSGNSVHQRFSPLPATDWEFAAPAYTGSAGDQASFQDSRPAAAVFQ